ncbi:hypothetical protein ABW19_dt0208582 [Dactylella cylindrospora]|nr:hypothetical protein ABW19_dt0208582 [Dactylella cylindrospora]
MCGPCPHQTPPFKCTHPNHIRNPPLNNEFDLVSISDGLGRFDTVPFSGVVEQWELDRAPSSISGTPADRILSMLLIQSSCYCYEQLIYSNVINCILEIFDVHGPKMLRGKKKIGGSYYYNLCEVLKETENKAAAATFMMAVTAGKRADVMVKKNPWGGEGMCPTQLSLWNLFYDVLSFSADELEETIQSWTRTAKEWSRSLMGLKCAHKRLQNEFPLYMTEIFDSDEDKEKVQQLTQECLRAGDDRHAIANDKLKQLRREVLELQKRLDTKADGGKLTLYDIDLLRFYVVALGQICTTGDLIAALVAWQERREEGMKKLIGLATDRMQKDELMQELSSYDSTSNESSSGEGSGSDSEAPKSELTSPTISTSSLAGVPILEKKEMKLEDIVVVELNESATRGESS